MNIIVALDKNDEQINNVLTGWGFALNALGYNLIMYHGQTPIFKVFDEYRPQYFLTSAATINKTFQKVVKEFAPETWVLFRKNDEFKLHIEGSKEIGVLTEGDTNVGQYYAPFGWDQINFGRQKKRQEYISKYSYVGRYNPKLEKIFNELGSNLRIYSPDPHQSLSYVGDDNNKPAIYASSEIVVLGETDDGGGLIDTDMWNVLYSGAKAGISSNPTLDGSHSYFHRIYEFASRACKSYNILTIKLFEKMKEVENENRINTQ